MSITITELCGTKQSQNKPKNKQNKRNGTKIRKRKQTQLKDD